MNDHIDNIINNSEQLDNNEKCSITPDTTYNIYCDNANENIFFAFYQEGIKNRKNIDNNLPIAFRIGINKHNVICNCENIMDNIQKNTETVLLKLTDANKYYSDNENNYPNNSIVMDFFKIDKNDCFVINETHMITLFKIDKLKIHIYDPSNTDFSSKICSYLNQKTKHNFEYIKIEYPKNILYKAPTDKSLIGFSDYSTQYPLWRSCKDVAIKISFHLNELQKLKTNINNYTINIYKQFSNTTQNLLKYDAVTIRELQSSSFLIRCKRFYRKTY